MTPVAQLNAVLTVTRPFGRFLLIALTLLSFFTCRKDEGCRPQNLGSEQSRYYVLNIRGNNSSPGLTFLPMNIHQQTTEYSCGPSAVVTLLGYYGRTADEMQIAAEMGTSTTCGTNPAQMADWLSTNGFVASWHENGSLEMLQAELAQQTPVLVEWSDWGGHWVLVVGYDTRGTSQTSDDVIIFADPYDRHDDHADGYNWFNAERFYYMWYDARLFGSFMQRIYIDAIPL